MAVFEAKQTANAQLVAYAQEKAASVRRLHRTSLPIPYAKGVYPPKPLIPILSGLLTFESDWTPGLGPSFQQALGKDTGEGRLDIGCVAAHGNMSLQTMTLLRVGARPATVSALTWIGVWSAAESPVRGWV